MIEVDFTPAAEADLARLDADTAQRVFLKLRWLAENFAAVKPEALTGQWQGVFKLRVGDYRILYTLHKGSQKITVHFVRHRREVYKIT
jgi:mRNA interferase RelE/StbE